MGGMRYRHSETHESGNVGRGDSENQQAETDAIVNRNENETSRPTNQRSGATSSTPATGASPIPSTSCPSASARDPMPALKHQGVTGRTPTYPPVPKYVGCLMLIIGTGLLLCLMCLVVLKAEGNQIMKKELEHSRSRTVLREELAQVVSKVGEELKEAMVKWEGVRMGGRRLKRGFEEEEEEEEEEEANIKSVKRRRMKQENMEWMKTEMMGGLKKYVDDQMKEFSIKSQEMGQQRQGHVGHEGEGSKSKTPPMDDGALDSIMKVIRSELGRQVKHRDGGGHDEEGWDLQKQEREGLGGGPTANNKPTQPTSSTTIVQAAQARPEESAALFILLFALISGFILVTSL
mmetsp:Transcript_23341/g.39163  ORF Transcript_23341/g.39163 Transcript_23341/m.39163 type:complete len:348 (+) Transcript_23341:189-1232(+)